MFNKNIFKVDENGVLIDEQMTTIEKIIHSKKLNYEELYEICKPYFLNNEKETVNIYIDLFDICKQLYSPMLKDDFSTIRTNGRMCIISEIINIVGHYRHFFATRFQKYTTIIFYYSTKKDNYYLSLDKDYKKEFYNKRIKELSKEFFVVNKVMEDCIEIIKEYLNYIPHAYLIDTKNMDSRLLPYSIQNTNIDLKEKVYGDDFNIIMSNDDLVLLNLLTNKDTIVFKNHGRGKSYMIDKSDIFNELKLEDEIGLPKDILLLLYAIGGKKSLNIKNVKGYALKKAFKLLTKLFKADKNILIFNDKDSLKELFKDVFKEDEIELIYKNIKLLNNKLYPFTNEKLMKISNQLIDIKNYDYITKETLDNFNSRFGSNYIIFNYLFDGEE